ncbi:hypothetical protein ACJMK2_035114 [Sinanodonta woodiana]|uniref:Pseudouridine synthase RsuA/RluA-like domain-containing protein n=1 Tax=Sinanodonta woodiana TaxID=1069815 RepID=A0ABD3WXW4_SINWO
MMTSGDNSDLPGRNAHPVILYKSVNFLVIDKAWDIKINSNDPKDVTVATQLSQMFPDLVDTSTVHGFRFVHRLDYATTGVLCLALNRTTGAKIHMAFVNKKVTKHYLALVRGHVSCLERVVKIAIGKDSSVMDINKMCTTESPHCKAPRMAVTKMVCLEKGVYDNQPVSKILMLPFTGRTHQLRVHCHHIGHPVVGDFTYSNRTDIGPFRMMLHAYRLTASLDDEKLDVTASDPFTPACDKNWQPNEICFDYGEAVERLEGEIEAS